MMVVGFIVLLMVLGFLVSSGQWLSLQISRGFFQAKFEYQEKILMSLQQDQAGE